MAAPALIGQTADYNTTGPVIDGLGSGSALSGYRTAATAYTASDLADGEDVILLIYNSSDYTVWAIWDASYDQASGEFDQNSSIASAGTLNNNDGVDIYVVEFAGPEVIEIAVTNEISDLTTGTGKATFRMPFAMKLTDVRASVKTAPTGSTIEVDVNDGGTTIFSTILSIDASEKTSTTAATAAVISDTDLADDAEITIDIDQVGSTVAGAGLKVTLIGRRV